MYRVILAGSHTEAVSYARAQGWRAGSYRVATRAGTIRGLRFAEIHELPSFEKRLDRHAVEAVLRRSTGERIKVTDWVYPPPPPEPVQPELPFDVLEQDPTLNISVENDPVAVIDPERTHPAKPKRKTKAQQRAEERAAEDAEQLARNRDNFEYEQEQRRLLFAPKPEFAVEPIAFGI